MVTIVFLSQHKDSNFGEESSEIYFPFLHFDFFRLPNNNNLFVFMIPYLTERIFIKLRYV